MGSQPWERGQSSVLGVALLFAIVIAVSASVVLIGTQALEQQEQATSMEGATASFQRLDADLAEVASGSQQRVSMADLGKGKAKIQGDRGRVMINITDESGNDCSVLDKPLGRIVYEEGDRVVAYQGGGVFARTSGSANSTVVSPPGFQYQQRNGEATLSMPLVLVNGTATDGDLSLERADRQTRFPGTACPAIETNNPVTHNYTVHVTIESEFYRAWGQALEQRAGLDPEYGDSVGNVSVTVNGSYVPGASGLFPAGSFGGGFTMNNEVQFDSYDSHPYPGFSANSNTDIEVPTGDWDIQSGGSNGAIHGRVDVAENAYLSSEIEFHGPVVVGGTRGDGDPNTITSSGGSAPTFHDLLSSEDSIETSSTTVTFNDDVRSGGTVSLKDDVVHGDVHAGEDVEMPNQYAHGNVIDGNIYAAGDVTIDQGTEFQGDREIVAAGDVTVHCDNCGTVDIVANGSVTIGSDAELTGDVRSNETVTVESGATVKQSGGDGGDVYVSSASDFTNNGGTVEGSVQTVSDPAPRAAPPLDDRDEPIAPDTNKPPSSNPIINDAESRIPDDDSGTTISAIESTSPASECSSECELTHDPDGYYLERIDIQSGETLELNTSGGDIEIYVASDADGGSSPAAVEVDGTLQITGDNQVRIYNHGGLRMDNQHSSGNNRIMTGTTGPTGTHKADKFTMFVRPNRTVGLVDANYTGVLYGASGSGGGVAIDFATGNVVYGAVVGETTGSMRSDTTIHYDEALSGAELDPSGSGATGRITDVGFFHVSTTTVTADS